MRALMHAPSHVSRGGLHLVQPNDGRPPGVPREAVLFPRFYIYVVGRVPRSSSRAHFGGPIDEYGTTTASGPSYQEAVLDRLQAHRTFDPSEAQLFFSPHTKDPAWSSNATAVHDFYWSTSPVNYFRRRGGWDHFFAAHNYEYIKNQGRSWMLLANATKFVGVLQWPWSSKVSRDAVARRAEKEHVTEVPYGGSVHNSSFWQRAHLEPRPLLIAAAFNSFKHRNTLRQMDLRKRLEIHLSGLFFGGGRVLKGFCPCKAFCQF